MYSDDVEFRGKEMCIPFNQSTGTRTLVSRGNQLLLLYCGKQLSPQSILQHLEYLDIQSYTRTPWIDNAMRARQFELHPGLSEDGHNTNNTFFLLQWHSSAVTSQSAVVSVDSTLRVLSSTDINIHLVVFPELQAILFSHANIKWT